MRTPGEASILRVVWFRILIPLLFSGCTIDHQGLGVSAAKSDLGTSDGGEDARLVRGPGGLGGTATEGGGAGGAVGSGGAPDPSIIGLNGVLATGGMQGTPGADGPGGTTRGSDGSIVVGGAS